MSRHATQIPFVHATWYHCYLFLSPNKLHWTVYNILLFSLFLCLLSVFFYYRFLFLLRWHLPSFSPIPMDSSSTSISRFRVSANSFLSQYEPLALLLVPLLSLLLAHSLRSFLRLLSENGLKATLLGFIMNAVKYKTPLHAMLYLTN